jgi:serine/threonine protein kinase
LSEGYKEVQIQDFRGLVREPWPSSIPLEDLLGKIGQADGIIVKMRAERAVKIRGDLHLKEEFFRGWGSWPLRVKGLWGRSRLRRQWQASLLAREKGILTPEPLAYLERRRSFLLSQSLLVTRYEPGFATLTLYLREKTKEGWLAGEEGAFVKFLAAAVRRMHDLGMAHSDLKGSNILVKEEDGAWSFQFTDLKAACFLGRKEAKGGRGMTKKKRDILRLLASLRSFFGAPERALFLQSCLSLGAEEAQPIIARWEAKSQRKFPFPRGQRGRNGGR